MREFGASVEGKRRMVGGRAAVWFFENNECAKNKNRYVHFSKTMVY
jgi:hypothetical protein